MKLRDYQQDAVRGVLSALRDDRSTLLVLPTGCGKTITFCEVIRRVVVNDSRALVLAHRGELLTQAADKLRKFAGSGIRTQIEQGANRASKRADVVCASVQSMVNRLGDWPPDHFKLIVIDEAHHATAATYRKILAHFAPARVMGVTATPDRGDGTGLRNVFDSVAFTYPIRTAIEAGYLVPIRQRLIVVDGLDLSRVKKNRGDLSLADLEAQLMQEGQLHGVVAPLLAERGDRPTILFATTVAHAHALATLINEYVGGGVVTAEAVDGSSPQAERDQVVARFTEGKTPILVNCALFTEGFDAPLASCVAVARPTQSRALYAQMIGRGTRLSPETGKTDLLVLDFVDNARKHSLACVVDVLGGEDIPEPAKKRAAELAEGGADPLEAIDQALEESRAVVVAEAQYKSRDVDPFGILQPAPPRGAWSGQAPTEAQASVLERALGKHMPDDVDKGQASSLIDAIQERRRANLCSYKQARILARAGLNPDLTFELAREAIDIISANKWKAPPSLLNDPRFK